MRMLQISTFERTQIVEALRVLLKEDKSVVLQENKIWKELRSLKHLGYNQKFLISQMLQSYIENNYEFLRRIFVCISTQQFDHQIRDYFYETLVQHCVDQQFNFLSESFDFLEASDQEVIK